MAPWNWDWGGVGGNYDDRVQRYIFCFWRMRSTAAPPGWGCHCHGNCGTEFTPLSPVTVHQCVCVCVCVCVCARARARVCVFRCIWSLWEDLDVQERLSFWKCRLLLSFFIYSEIFWKWDFGGFSQDSPGSSVSLPSQSTQLYQVWVINVIWQV